MMADLIAKTVGRRSKEFTWDVCIRVKRCKPMGRSSHQQAVSSFWRLAPPRRDQQSPESQWSAWFGLTLLESAFGDVMVI